MSLSNDILATYRGPRRVVSRLLGMGHREDRALAILMGACLLMFISDLPRIARTQHLEGGDTTQALSYAFMGWLLLWPLLFYGVAGLAHLVSKVIGGQGTWYSARLATFWALLAATPLALLNGLTAGFVGEGPALQLVGLLWIGAFGFFWVQGMRAASAEAAV
ncbi:hypothetical protein [Nereida sp. MMG025]|uniref:hypothetical protein n=1 Tax=Nereida sp. MMG025 TaxID=2909981 RepID=UPI001F1C38F9|nr:hypothetical protein [Nereida sp. MMG025]MCF6443135.1 hypothetical protein [Nereida sp. MMG025]